MVPGDGKAQEGRRLESLLSLEIQYFILTVSQQ